MKNNTYYGLVTPGEMNWMVYVESADHGRHNFDEKKAHRAGFAMSDGVSWGYIGSGPTQLAAALLLEETEDVEFTREWLDLFCREVIAALDKNKPFRLTSGQIEEWCDEHKAASSFGARHEW